MLNSQAPYILKLKLKLKSTARRTIRSQRKQSTIDAIFMVTQIFKKSIELNAHANLSFVDLANAFEGLNKNRHPKNIKTRTCRKITHELNKKCKYGQHHKA